MSCLAALCLQLTLGLTHANPQDCGIWYVCEPNAPYVQHLNSLTWSAGVEAETYRVGYEKLGRFGTDSFVPQLGAIHEYGYQEGVYLEYKWGSGWNWEAGLWVYRSGVSVNCTCGPPYGSGSIAPGLVAGVSRELGKKLLLRWSIRMAENRSVDQNNNHEPSTIKAFVQTVSIGYNF